jgi:hypothetical protein
MLLRAPVASVTVTENVKQPAVAGVPEILQLARVSPGGSIPAVTRHLYPGVPQLAVIVCSGYIVPAIPSGSVGGEIAIGPLPTATVYARLPVHPLASVAVTVKVYLPGAVGVPQSVPLENTRPAGGAPDEKLKVYGGVPQLAVKAVQYWAHVVATGSVSGKTITLQSTFSVYVRLTMQPVILSLAATVNM